MIVPLLQDGLQSRNFLDDQQSSLFALYRLNFLLVVINVCVDDFQFFLQVGLCTILNDFLSRSRHVFLVLLLLLLLQHFVNLNDLVLELPVPTLQLLDVIIPNSMQMYLMSRDSYSFSCILLLPPSGSSPLPSLAFLIVLLLML